VGVFLSRALDSQKHWFEEISDSDPRGVGVVYEQGSPERVPAARISIKIVFARSGEENIQLLV
jgi:hypothetical protein